MLKVFLQNILTRIIIPGTVFPPPGTLFFRQYTDILAPFYPVIPFVACKLVLHLSKKICSPFDSGAAFPALPWCVGPLAPPTPQTTFPPEPVEEVPNDLNVLESVQEITSKGYFPKPK